MSPSQEYLYRYLSEEGHNFFAASQIQFFNIASCLYYNQNPVFRSESFSIYLRFFSMPTTRKQKKTRKSRGLEILSDIENLDIKLAERHSEVEVNVNSNSVRRPENANSSMFGNIDGDMYLNHREMGFGDNIDPGHNSASGYSNIEINWL